MLKDQKNKIITLKLYLKLDNVVWIRLQRKTTKNKKLFHKINQSSNIENLDFYYYLDFGFMGLSSQIESCSIIFYASFKVVEVVLN